MILVSLGVVHLIEEGLVGPQKVVSSLVAWIQTWFLDG